VFHLLLSERRDDVPVVRDFITDADRELRGRQDESLLSGAGTHC
jgi:hypothetical protein